MVPVNVKQCTALPHITASVFINDDAGPMAGCTTAPDRAAAAHLKQHGPPSEAVVAVTNGRLNFGTWERILEASHSVWPGSLDGRLWKRVLVKTVEE